MNLIFCAFAVDSNKKTGANVNKSNYLDTYYENVCVALSSASYQNKIKETKIALVTNILPPKKYLDVLNVYGVSIYLREFDRFVFGNEVKWGLAFYKICALSYMLDEDFDSYCMLDCDVFVQNSLSDIWEECKQNLLLYDFGHGLQVEDYKKFAKESSLIAQHIGGKNNNITQYGGEFVAGNKGSIKLLLDEMLSIYNLIISKRLENSFGDEMLLSLAAYNLMGNNPHLIKNASPYIFRFWTGSFRLVSTCYRFNPVCILHIPSEKTNGFKKLFRMIKNGKIPKNTVVWNICHLRKMSFKNYILMILNKQ